MWNSSSLEAPAVYTFKATSPLIDISAVASVLNNAIKVLNSQNILELESKLLSRCVYRMKLKFRNDKGFKLMEKTVKVLKTALHFDILNDLKVFLNALPKKYEKDFYLPTKQMLEYVLVRLQGYSKLLCRVVESSKSVAEFMNCRLQLGHFWTTAAVILALISRIWQITKFLTEKCCSWFNTLLPLRDKFEINGVKWLPDDYVFPTDLIEWLNVGWIFEKPHIFNKLQFDLPIFSLLDDSDDEVEFCNQYKMNDCFVVEDGTFVDNDVQIIGGNLKTEFKKEEEKSLILIDDESDIEITNNTSDPFICDSSDDIGESISRNIYKIDQEMAESSRYSTIIIDNDNGESIARQISPINLIPNVDESSKMPKDDFCYDIRKALRSRKTISIELDKDIDESPIKINNAIGESSNIATIKIDNDADKSSDESIIIDDSQSKMSIMCIDDDIGESISSMKTVSCSSDQINTEMTKGMKIRNKKSQIEVSLHNDNIAESHRNITPIKFDNDISGVSNIASIRIDSDAEERDEATIIAVSQSLMSTTCIDDIGESLSRKRKIRRSKKKKSKQKKRKNKENESQVDIRDDNIVESHTNITPIKIDNDIGKSSKIASIKTDNDADKSSKDSTISVTDDIVECIPSTAISLPNNESITKLSKRQKRRLKKNMKQLNLPPSEAATSKLRSLKELHRFLKYEHAMRRTDLQQCFTKNITDARWVQLYYQMSMLKVSAEINSRKVNNYLLKARVALQKALNEVSQI